MVDCCGAYKFLFLSILFILIVVIREWFTKLSDCIFDPMHALFLPCNSGCYMRINSGSGINERDLEYFGFIGRLLGIALVHKLNIDLRFVPGVYKLMLGSRKLGLNDLKAQDPELYRSLNWILWVILIGFLGVRELTYPTERTK